MRTIRLFAIAIAAISLASCGGGSSSGGGQLAGNYVGTARFTFSGPGGTFGASGPAVLVVTGSGQVGFALLTNSSGSTCSATPPIRLRGNTFNYSIQYRCSFSNLGTCSIVENGSGRIVGNTATAQVNGVAACPGGTLSVVGSFSGARQYAAASAQSKSKNNTDMLDALRDAL